MIADIAARERASCQGGFRVIRYDYGWVVVHPLPPDSPYGRAYLTDDGRWSVTAYYFESDNEARTAMLKATPPCRPDDSAEQSRRRMHRRWRWCRFRSAVRRLIGLARTDEEARP